MTLIVRLITRYALWIYLLCGLGMLLYLRAALGARNEGSQAMFSLEREHAAKRVYNSSGMILVLLLIVVGVYALSNYVELSPINTGTATTPDAAEMGTIEAKEGSTPAPDAASGAEPTPADDGLTPAGAETPTREPTPTRRPLVTAIPLPEIEQSTPVPQAPVPPAVCPHPNVQVAQPGQSQVIDAGIQVRGTADKEGFDRYEFKFRSLDLPGDEWHWVETFRVPVLDGDLGFWSTAHLPPGRYQFMLIAIYRSGNSQECLVPVIIQR
jgi:hypothetical protein